MRMKELKTEGRQASFGCKINHLIELRNLGLAVPDGLILSAEQIQSWLQSVWPSLTPVTDLDKSVAQELLEQLAFPPTWQQDLQKFFQPGKTYIVRSSGLMEDGADLSFAGQYDSISDCRSLAELEAGIRSCILSLFNPEALAYWQRQQLSWQDFGLAILIQEQIEPDFSGVCFSMDLQANDDQTMLVEYVTGLAHDLVSGWVDPQQLRISWYQPDWLSQEKQELPLKLVRDLHAQTLNIAAHFGRPMDIEWCAVENRLYLVQARPITSLPTKVDQGRWTTANFRDGGVAAQPCPNLMWSLYHDSWQLALGTFLEEIGLEPQGSMPELMQLHYARPYWNLGVVKQGMEQIPGYIERDFDDELGVNKDYQGQGYTSKLSPSLLFNFLRVAWRTQKATKRFLKAAPHKLADLRKRFAQLAEKIEQLGPDSPLENLEALWEEILAPFYLDCEKTYFWQAYINTVQLSMKKTALLKWLTLAEFFQLIAHLGNVSHTKPLAAMLETADLILADKVLEGEWCCKSLNQLLSLASQQPNRPDFLALEIFKNQFGHHSKRELDLRVASYQEEPQQIIAAVQHLVADPAYYQAVCSSLAGKADPPDLSRLTSGQRKKVQRISQELRELLWWREEFKDCSTHGYHLIRQISLKLGQAYEKRGYLQQAEDIFYLTKGTVAAFMENHDGAAQLRQAAADNRHYCRAYSQFEPVGDLTEKEMLSEEESANSLSQLTGMPASGGLVIGRVRVLLDLAEIDQIQPGEILVTRFTDTGWSYVFGILGGLVTEYGGVLCHASIVARECGIPALVCAKQATQILQTGMLVTLDAEKGEIHIHEE